MPDGAGEEGLHQNRGVWCKNSQIFIKGYKQDPCKIDTTFVLKKIIYLLMLLKGITTLMHQT